MVSFRFYVVATVALFLALAVGIVVGSALNDAIVPSLKQRIARVESNLDESVAAMDQHKREIERFEQFVTSAAPYAVEDRLAGTTTFVVAEPGASEDDVHALVVALDEANSEVDGVVWLSQRWKLDKAADKTRLATITSTPDSGSTSARRRAAWDAVMAELTAADGAGGNAPAGGLDVTTTTASGTAFDLYASPVLRGLIDEGFLRLETNDVVDAASGGSREVLVVAIASPRSTLSREGAETAEIAAAAAASKLPTVAAESYNPTNPNLQRGTTLEALRDASPAGVSTVDDLDLVAGQVGTVLALAELRTDHSGHYGYGPGSDRVIPEWSKN